MISDNQLAILLKSKHFQTKRFTTVGEQKIHKVAEDNSSFTEDEKRELLREVENIRNKIKKFLAMPGDSALISLFKEEKIHSFFVIVGSQRGNLGAVYDRIYRGNAPYIQTGEEKKHLIARFNQVLNETKI